MKLSLSSLSLVVVLAAPVAVLAGESAKPDAAVVNICIDLKRAQRICNCAALELAKTADPVQFRRYAAVAAGYLSNKYEGMLRRQAWQHAVTGLAEHENIEPDTLFNQMDDATGAHRQTMLYCSQQ